MTLNDIITLPVSKAIFDKTANNTIRKYSFTHRTLMYGRTPVELLDNIFMGDIAKNSLLEYLRSNCNEPIIDYDEIRTDNYLEPDPGWDFKVGKSLIKVEVKSSTPPNNENHLAIINNRDIKITASHNNGMNMIPPNNLESDIHIQIYFYAKPYRNGYDNFQNLQNDLTANPDSIHRIINSAKYREPLFFGWNTKTNIIRYSNTLNPPTWSFSWTTRVYWRCPILEAMTLNQLIDFINSN
jgi:hypothetical protein